MTVTDPGSGYLTTVPVTFVGGNGTGAQASTVMNNHMVREFAVRIKFDRYQYATTIHEWQAGYSYATGAQVRWLNRVWSADASGSSTTFDPNQWSLVNAGTLSGVDRTMGYYTPTPNMPGLSLPLLINGVSYPGVQVMGLNYSAGQDTAQLDTVYSSSYVEPYLGLKPTDINVAGGAYIDGYSSHAPEELIPGIEFDTLDFRVYTTGGPTNGADFRIFQDLRGLQLAYTITAGTTTTVTQAVTANADVIHVANAGALFVPDFNTNQWGVVTINAERIMYRSIDTVANTISNLIRGTAGTAVTAHSNGSTVYNMSSNNLFGKQYQNYTVEDTTVANGVATVFNAPSITLSTSTTTWVLTNTYALGNIVKNSGNFYRAKQAVPANTPIANTQYWQPLSTAVEVYVGGQRISSDLYTITAESPVQVTFDTAPAAGSNVTVLVRRGTWVDY